MPKYEITIPFYAFLTFEVEAEDEDAAYDAEVPDGAVYTTCANGIAPADGCRLTTSGEYIYEKLEIELKD